MAPAQPVFQPLGSHHDRGAFFCGVEALDMYFQRYARQGEMLLFDALWRSWEQSAIISAVTVIVDAKNDPARAFYEYYDFTPVLDDEYHLYLSMKTIEHMVQSDG